MISFTLRSSIAIGLISFFLGFVCCAFLLGRCNNDKQSKTHLQVVQNLEQQIKDSEAVYHKKVYELENKNSQLQKELRSAQSELLIIKRKTSQRETRIKNLIQPQGLPAKDFLKKVTGSSMSNNINPSNCDSLANEVTEYIKENALKDSLYETHIQLQDSVIVNKDSIIANTTKLHSELKTAFDFTIQQQKQLISQNEQLFKKLKRQKRRSKLISVGMMVLSGAAVNYLQYH